MSVKTISLGTVISFRSKNPNDLVVWQGTLEAIGTYRTIRSYMNPASYNEAVRQTDASVPSDVTELNYFLITVDNQSENASTRVFADEWIAPGSLHEVALGNQVTIKVDDPKNNTQAILSLLASAGYASKVIL